MASNILDRVAMVITDLGTGDVTANVLISDRFNTPQEAGAQNGKSYWWMLEEGTDYQIFEGVWTLAGTKVARTRTWQSKILGVHGATNMDLKGNATLRAITPAEALTFSRFCAPQGRLTLQSGVPVMTTTQSAKTTIYYPPYAGNQVPIYDGINMVSMSFTELSAATTDTSKSPAAIGASKVNDWFVWSDNGVLRIGHGPDWTNDTTRSAGTALVMVDGVLLNAVAITNGPAASRGTYVGTTRSNASSQLDFIIGGGAASGVAGFVGLWNAYNRKPISMQVMDTTAFWTYSSATIRAANNSANMRVSFVRGLDEDETQAHYAVLADSSTSPHLAFGGVGLDSVATYSGMSVGQQPLSGQVRSSVSGMWRGYAGIGFHYISANESVSTSATTGTYIGMSNGVQQSGLNWSAHY